MINEKVTHTPGLLEDYFQLSYLIGETVSSEVYRAVRRDDTCPVSLWKTKFAYDLVSDDAHNVIKHLHALDQIDPPIAPAMEMYGIDSEGICFACFDNSLLNNIGKQRGAAAEMSRRFFKIVRLIHKTHSSKVIFGDLNINSFWLGHTGEVEFSGVLPLFNNLPNDAFQNVPPDIAAYVAPEILHGSVTEPRTDVYSLGMIGYKLLCDSLPITINVDSNHKLIPAKKQNFTIPDEVSADISEVLYKAISQDPQERYTSASELLEALVNVHEREGKGEKKTKRNPSDTNLPAVRKPGALTTAIEKPETKPGRVGYNIFFISLLILIIATVGLYVFFQQSYKERLAQEINEATAPFSGGNPELSQAVARFTDLTAEDSEKIKEIENLINSQDPLAYRLLIAGASEHHSRPVVIAAEQGIIRRLKNDKLERAVVQLEQWLRYSKTTPADPIYQSVLKSLDPVMPVKKRNQVLLKVGQDDLNIATRLATALYFDLDQSELIQPLLFHQVGKNLKIENAENQSALALILHHEALSQIFSEDILKHIDLLKNEDLDSLLPVLAKRNDPHILALVNLALDKGLYGEQGKYFLIPIKNNPEIAPDIKESLVMAANGHFTKDHFRALANWQGEEAEKILYMLCRFLKDVNVKVMALDTLAAKGSIQLEPGAGIIRWLKQHAWTDRAKYISAIGTLMTSSSATEEDIQVALESFGDKLDQAELKDIILDSQDEKIPAVFVREFASRIELAQKLNLLYHNSAKVRAAIIPTIDTNDVGAMKLIVSAYEQETNPDLKKQYQDAFWFVKGR